ncbi:MAG: ATP-binding protein [Chloroflexota bacterium]
MQIKDFFLPPPKFKTDQAPLNEDVLGPIQERILIALLRLSFIFGVVTLILGFYPTIRANLYIQYSAGVLSVIGTGLLLYFSNLSHQTRATILMTTAYIFSLITIFEGPNELTFVLLFSFIVMVSLLIGIRGGVIAFFIAILTIIGINFGLNQSFLAYRLDFFELSDAPSGLFFILLYWSFFVAIFVLTAWVYFDGFDILLKREKEARLQMETERDRLANALVREKKLISQLEASYNQANELSKLQSQIITAVAHEFRTPLTVIKSSSELLAEYLDRLTAEKRIRIQKRISESVLSLNQLLQDIENSNLEGNSDIQVNLVPTSMVDYRERLDNFLQTEFKSTQLEAVWSESESSRMLLIDTDLIERVLTPVIMNGLKFSPESSKVRVYFEVSNELRIRVKDSGIGIEADEIGRIWEPFYRAENALTFRGLGLGLSFALLIVDVLGGEITAVSDGPNQGAEFEIKLPC